MSLGFSSTIGLSEKIFFRPQPLQYRHGEEKISSQRTKECTMDIGQGVERKAKVKFPDFSSFYKKIPGFSEAKISSIRPI